MTLREETIEKQQCDAALFANLFNVLPMMGFVFMDILYITIDVDDQISSIVMTILSFFVVVDTYFYFKLYQQSRDKSAPYIPFYRDLPLVSELLNIVAAVMYFVGALLTFANENAAVATQLATVFDQTALFILTVGVFIQWKVANKAGELSPVSLYNLTLWGHACNIVPQLLYVAAWGLGLAKQRSGSVVPRIRRKRFDRIEKHYDGPVRSTRSSAMDGLVIMLFFVADIMFFVGSICWTYAWHQEQCALLSKPQQESEQHYVALERSIVVNG